MSHRSTPGPGFVLVWLVAIAVAWAEEPSYSDVYIRLARARKLSFAARDAMSSADVYRETRPRLSATEAQRARGLAAQAQGIVAEARGLLARAAAAGSIGEGSAQSLERYLGDVEADLAAPLATPIPEPPKSGEEPEEAQGPALPDPALPSARNAVVIFDAFGMRIEEAYKFHAELYGVDHGAPETLRQRFQESGCDLDHWQSWGRWLGDAVIYTFGRQRAWISVLRGASRRLREGQGMDRGYMTYMDREMMRWREESDLAEDLAARMVEIDVESGLLLQVWLKLSMGDPQIELIDAKREKLEAEYDALKREIQRPSLLAPPLGYDEWFEGSPQERLDHGPELATASRDGDGSSVDDEDEEFPRIDLDRLGLDGNARRESTLFRDRSLAALDLAREKMRHGKTVWDIAPGFDSAYFEPDFKTLVYEMDGIRGLGGIEMIGGRVNYFFQGMLFSLLGESQTKLDALMMAHNIDRYGRMPDSTQYFAAHQGHRFTEAARAWADRHSVQEAREEYRRNTGKDLPEDTGAVPPGLYAFFSAPRVQMRVSDDQSRGVEDPGILSKAAASAANNVLDLSGAGKPNSAAGELRGR